MYNKSEERNPTRQNLFALFVHAKKYPMELSETSIKKKKKKRKKKKQIDKSETP